MTARLEIKDLRVRVQSADSNLQILRGVSLELRQGETLGIVGESGCGKSTTILATLGLLSSAMDVDGEILLDGTNLVGLDPRGWTQIRGKRIACVFQNARGSLHPMIRVGRQIERAWRHHTGQGRTAARSEVRAMLASVGFPDPDQIAPRYPHQLSGGQCQRIMIALALIMKPEVLVADEPTSGLDVSIQREVLDTLKERAQAFDTSVILVSHDLKLIEKSCDRVAVMYAGQVVEQGTAHEVFAHPRHPYTLGLIQSEAVGDRRMGFIPGWVPNLAQPLDHCAFAPRCAYVEDACWQHQPPLLEMGGTQKARCIGNVGGEIG